MELKNVVNLVFIILAESANISESDMRFVDYIIMSSGGTSHDRKSCAKATADSQYLAARINNVTGICEGLNWTWGSNPQYEPGFSYIRKTKTVEIYDPAIKVDASFQWLIPGSFGVGGSLEFHITMPVGTNWEWLEINLMDTVAPSYQMYDAELENLIMHLYMQRASNTLGFKTWIPYIWNNILFLSPIPFAGGSTHKVTIVPLIDVMKILFDDEEVVEYAHRTDPTTVKQMIFSVIGGNVLELHNITFVGV